MTGHLSLRRLAGPALGLAFSAFAAFGAQAQTKVKFTLDWRFEGWPRRSRWRWTRAISKPRASNVTIDTGSGSRESIPRVAAGTYDIGTGDVNSLIRFRDENPSIDLKAVMMIYDAPPFAIVGRKSKGMTADPKSLVGKPGFGGHGARPRDLARARDGRG